MSCAHPYGAVDATRTITTAYGTYHVCAPCAETLVDAHGPVASNRPLESENARQRCQCEHAGHFEAEPIQPDPHAEAKTMVRFEGGR
jgi:hypothetical protein